MSFNVGIILTINELKARVISLLTVYNPALQGFQTVNNYLKGIFCASSAFSYYQR